MSSSEENDAKKLFRSLAKDGHVAASFHAKTRMRRRRINMTQVNAIIEKGVFVEGPFRNIHGSWEAAIVGRHSGDELKAPCVIDESGDDGPIVILKSVVRR